MTSVRASLSMRAWSAAPRLLPGALCRVDAADAVAITIDDGPDPHATPEALAALERHGLRATFFLLGDAAAAHPSLVRAIRSAGHDIALHGLRHQSQLCRSAERIESDLHRAIDTLMEIESLRPRHFRPPHGRWNPANDAVLRRLDLRLTLWRCLPGDYRRQVSPDTIARIIDERLLAGDILVLHDGVAMAGRIGPVIDGLAGTLLRRGWDSVPLSDGAA
jgi:peptidoglycan-N-acetylglucosamine deacetylase